MSEQPARLLPSYGRRRGRKLRPAKQALMGELLPELELALPESQISSLQPLFGSGFNEYWLEIGFGGGEHLVHQAALHPDTGIIGCEPYINGTAALLSGIQSRGLTNIRIYPHDVRPLLDTLPDASLTRVFILYPDPWPKARHNKRRLVQKPLLDALARVMRADAQLLLATDDEDYCTWMLEHLLPHPAFAWQAKRCRDWLEPPQDWLSTRYEQKALVAGRVPTYLRFKRVDYLLA